jgi:peptidyl-tRNA hydrolase, PTH1 family
MVVDAIAGSMGIEMRSVSKYGALISRGLDDVMFVKPTTFMNASGESISKLVHVYKTTRIIVIHDDLESPLGSVRLIPVGGGHRGHNGMRSVLAHVKNVMCIRIGIGRPPQRNNKVVADYVLGDFDGDLETTVEKVREIISGIASACISRG